jgi:hypothetical protein
MIQKFVIDIQQIGLKQLKSSVSKYQIYNKFEIVKIES